MPVLERYNYELKQLISLFLLKKIRFHTSSTLPNKYIPLYLLIICISLSLSLYVTPFLHIHKGARSEADVSGQHEG
jgi:hypothetical protein